MTAEFERLRSDSRLPNKKKPQMEKPHRRVTTNLITIAEELKGETINNVTTDAEGNLWMYMDSGIKRTQKEMEGNPQPQMVEKHKQN